MPPDCISSVFFHISFLLVFIASRVLRLPHTMRDLDGDSYRSEHNADGQVGFLLGHINAFEVLLQVVVDAASHQGVAVGVLQAKEVRTADGDNTSLWSMRKRVRSLVW